MFSVLSVTEEKRSVLRRRKCEVEMILSPVKGAAPYKVINVSPGKKGINWKTVALAAGNSAGCMLLPQGVRVPETSGVAEFVPRFLPGVILLNTIAALSAERNSEKLSALVDDQDGLLAGYIERIVPYVAKITVVTQSPEKYFKPTVDIMDRYGATVKVCMRVNESERFDYGISQEDIAGVTKLFKPSSLIEGKCKVIFQEEILRMCPHGINPFLFVCALFECSGLRCVGDLTLQMV